MEDSDFRAVIKFGVFTLEEKSQLCSGIRVRDRVDASRAIAPRGNAWSNSLRRIGIIRSVNGRFSDGVADNLAGVRMSQLLVVGVNVVSTL
jgi:hypothetical protein